MKKLVPIALIAVVSTFGFLSASAADKVEKPPAPTTKKESRPPFGGKIAALDAAAKTIKVGERTFHITPTTKILMAGKPSSLENAKVGDEVGGQYHEGEGGKLEVLSLRVGPKPEKKPKSDDKK